ncbi:MAG: DUF5009 domain-containing protein [Acidobacteriaceae bacterium]|nr:DUF5009 domain-containing protein [Acidobacteriaceae bacterium]
MSSNGTHASALPPYRNIAVDAYRGFVMLLMLAEVMHLSQIAQSFPHSRLWYFLGYNQSHAEWVGMSLHDTIQPSFTFLVGVALSYSLRSRQRKGESFLHQFAHTLWRSVILITLGVFLRSLHAQSTNYTFEDTLTQIGLGYSFAFLIAQLSSKWIWSIFASILLLYWLAWALYPVPSASFNYMSVGITPAWQSQYFLHGFAAHWNKNANLGLALDQRFLNLFPRPTRFQFNEGGYLTYNFIPTLGTTLLGVLTGRWLIASPAAVPLRKLTQTGAWLIAAGLLLHLTGINPIVKRIWTPAWTLFSGGVCLLMLSAFSWLLKSNKSHRFAYPLLVIGANSLAAYLMAHLCEEFILRSLHTHLNAHLFTLLGPPLEPLISGCLVLLIYFYMLRWMYENRIFLRV